MKTVLKITLLSIISISLSGCIAAAVGAGAAGGAYVERHYDVDFSVKKKNETTEHTH